MEIVHNTDRVINTPLEILELDKKKKKKFVEMVASLQVNGYSKVKTQIAADAM